MKRYGIISGIFLSMGGSALAAPPAPNYIFAYPRASISGPGVNVANGNPYENDIGPAPGVGGPANLSQSAMVNDAAGSLATVTITEAPVLLKAKTTSVGSDTATAAGQLYFTIAVPAAPPNGMPAGAVPLDFVFDLTSSATGGADASASLSFFADSGGETAGATVASVCSSSYPGGCAMGTVSSLDYTALAPLDVSLLPGQYTFMEKVNTDASYGGTSSASADPRIFVDPNFLANHPGYALALPPGLNVPSSAPEPAAWVLMILGIGLGGSALRRRRNDFARA